MPDAKADLSAAKSRLAAFGKASPTLMQAFGTLSRQASAPGAFSPAQKELIAVALAVAKGCEDCILFHLDGARRHGASESELVEALEIAVEMGGGPAVIYSGKALEAFRNLG